MTTARVFTTRTPAIRTFLIADIRGYTRFTARRGDEAASRLARKFAEVVGEAVEAWGGHLVELRGDEALVVFESARQALRCAVELQDALADESAAEPALALPVGIGLDAGEAVPVDDGYRGAALNLAARLCSVAQGGEVLASSNVVNLVGPVPGLVIGPLEPRALKGLERPVEAAQVAGAEPNVHPARHGTNGDREASGVPGTPPPPELEPVVPLIGREADLRWLRWHWRRARHGHGRTVVVFGQPGIGKTRLASELASGAWRDGGRIRYLPSGSGLETPSPAEETPVVPSLIVVDDLDAAPAPVQEVVVALSARQADAPTLVLVTRREEAAAALLQVTERLAPNECHRGLEPLGAEDVRAIAALYAGAGAEQAPIRQLMDASGGVPSAAHRAAAMWARSVAMERLASSAQRTETGRQSLRAAQNELIVDVADLERVGERTRRYDPVGPGGSAAGVTVCPYKGLATFEAVDAGYYFGRDRLIAELVAKLVGNPFLGFVGVSGGGKSSAVRAGLLPALAGGVLPGSDRWIQVVMRPGEHPVEELRRSLARSLPNPTDGGFAGADPIAEAVARLASDEGLVLVVDQFEEVFGATRDVAERGAFIDLLTRDRHGVRIVATLRADRYGQCAAYPALARMISATHVLVGPLTPAELELVVEAPAERVGLRVEPDLVRALVADAGGEAAVLPLLSTALLELWQARRDGWLTLDAYRAGGGLHGAVARLAEKAWAELDPGQAAAARSMFLRLAGPGNGEGVVRRRVALSELGADDDPAIASVLEMLTSARLLTTGDGYVEVAHEALLREWPRLQGWLDEDAEGRKVRLHLIGAARDWEQRGREPAELYRGARLSVALDWAAEHQAELNAGERAFLEEGRLASVRAVDRERRANRRLRTLLAAALVALIVAVSGATAAVLQRQAADTATTEANSQRTLAEQQRAAAQQEQALAESAGTAADAQRLGAIALDTRDLDLSLLLARQAVALDDSPATQANLLADLARSPAALRVLRPVPGRPQGVLASADGSTLLTWNNGTEFAVIDGRTGATRYTRTWDPSADLVGLTSAGEVYLWAFSAAPTLSTLDPRTGAVLRTVELPAAVTDQSFVDVAPDLSTFVATAADGRSLTVWNDTTVAPERTLVAPAGTVFYGVSAYRGGYLVTPLVPRGAAPRGPGELAVWPPNGSNPLVRFPIRSVRDTTYSMSPSLGELAVDNLPEPGAETLVDLGTGAPHPVQGQHTAPITGSAFSPDGKLLATGGQDEVARVWDAATGAEVATLQGHNGQVFAPAMSEVNGDVTAWTASLDGSIMSWDLTGDRSGTQPFSAGRGVGGDNHPHVAVSPDGQFLAVAQNGGALILTTTSHVPVHAFSVGSADSLPDVAWSPDGSRLAVSGDGSDSVEIFDTSTWRSVRGTLPGPASTNATSPAAVQALAFSPDSKTLAGGTDDGWLYRWDAITGDQAAKPIEVGATVYGVSIDPATGWIAAAYGGEAAVYAPDGTRKYTVNVDDGYGASSAVAFSPDGRTLATGGGTGDVRLWDATSGAPVGNRIRASAGGVLTIEWSSSGTTLLTGGTDGTARLADVESGLTDATFAGQPNVHGAATFASDGLSVFVAYAGGQGYQWSIDPAAAATRACAIAGRTLTQSEWQQYLPGRPYAPACNP